MSALDRGGQLFGYVLFVFFVGFGSSLNGFPFELEASSFENAYHRLSDFSADAVAGDQSDFVSHSQSRGPGRPRPGGRAVLADKFAKPCSARRVRAPFLYRLCRTFRL